MTGFPSPGFATDCHCCSSRPIICKPRNCHGGSFLAPENSSRSLSCRFPWGPCRAGFHAIKEPPGLSRDDVETLMGLRSIYDAMTAVWYERSL